MALDDISKKDTGIVTDRIPIPSVRESLKSINDNLKGIRQSLYFTALMVYFIGISYCSRYEPHEQRVRVTNMPSQVYVPSNR